MPSLLDNAWNLIFGTALLYYIFLGSFIIFLNSVCMTLFAMFVYPDELGSLEFSNAFNSIHVFFMIFLNAWYIKKTEQGFSGPIKLYLSKIGDLSDWTDRMDALSDKLGHFNVIAAYLVAHIYHMFNPSWQVNMEERVGIKRIRESDAITQIHQKHLNTYYVYDPKSGQYTYDPLTNLQFINFAKVMIYKELRKHALTISNSVHEPLNDVIKFIRAVIIDQIVNDPPVYVIAIIIGASLYFFILYPIHYWNQTGVFMGPLFNTIHTTIMLSPIMIARWLGNIFSSNRAVRIHEHENTTSETIDLLLHKAE